jgi:hypothetical protein
VVVLPISPPVRRGAGAVDRGGLENRCTLMGTEGSNPSLSARSPLTDVQIHSAVRSEFEV